MTHDRHWKDPKWYPKPLTRDQWRRKAVKDGSDWATLLRQRTMVKGWIKDGRPDAKKSSPPNSDTGETEKRASEPPKGKAVGS